MSRKNPTRAALVCIGVLTLLATMPALGAPSRRGSAFGRASMAGSGRASMQLETVPARVSRVVVRPGTGGAEAWALGTSTARVAGYDTSSLGQAVFLKYTKATGWVVTGPPRTAAGAIFNPLLASFDVRADGEGWAVGDAGTLLHKAAGSDAWIEAAQSRSLTDQALNVVSLSADAGGFAVGVGPTILRLASGSWTVEQAPEIAAQTTELQGVSAVSATEAWAIATGQVTGLDSTSLLIFRRTGSSWTRVTTGQATFDSPPAKSADGGLNRSAEAGAVAADARGAWIGGRMFPRSASSPDGDGAPGDTSRAFVVRIDATTQQATTYCADQYPDNTAGAVDLTRLCDQPFPTAPFHVASLSIVPGGDVFAGGLGLFRFSGDGWYREPDANGYVISLSMGSNTEGFVATPGRSLGAGGAIRSSATTIGHWTASPRRSAVARWSQPQDQLLQDIAFAGDGSGRAVAVGALGAAVMFSGSAWDSINPSVGQGLHGVAWPDGGSPWAVGQSGVLLHLNGLTWDFIDSPTTASLYSVAFRSRSEGVAVGLGGTILAFDNGRWRDDSPAKIGNDLYSVIVTPSGYLAVGKDGAVVEGRPGSWSLRPQARALIVRAGAPQAPTLYSATRMGDRIVIGGQDSTLIERTADGRYRSFAAPLQGTVLSLAASGDALYASLSPNEQKFRGEAPAAQRGTIMRYAAGRWSDIGLERHETMLKDKVDPARFDDPIYALAMTSPTTGWGVGGSPADLKDQTGGQFRSVSTGAVSKIAFGADPRQPASSAPLDPPQPGVSFAAFGESWCGTGLCSAAVGTGTAADDVSLQIRDEINAASKQAAGPKFVLFTGNMRRVGIPEELEQFRNYLKGFRIPVFVAPGTLDRFTGFDPTQGTGISTGTAGGSNNYWKSVFAAQPAPWGEAAAIASFVPAGPSTTPPDAGLARTHYAFDYLQAGRRALRVVVVDSSTRSYGTLQQQNPQEDQATWLAAVLAEASDVLNVPTVVVTNQAPFVPSDGQIPNWSAVNEQQHFETTVAGARVSAVVTGGPRVNATDTIKSLVPMFVVGGGGAPLGRDLQVQEGSATIEPASKLPSDGYYHAWHLFHLDPDDRLPVTRQARVTDQAFPVVESLAMHSLWGDRIAAGNTTTISAMARGLNGGFSDPDQAKTTYLVHGMETPRCGYRNQGNGLCVPSSSILPRFRFYSEDPSMAQFVERDPLDASKPRKIGTTLFPDPGGAQGLLCVFKLGKVGINAVAGLHRTRIVIEGTPGKGPCIDTEVKGTKIIETPLPVPQPQPGTKPQSFFRVQPRQELVVVFPPPPAPVVAPAPPGAPGAGRKEEHEVEFETESEDKAGKHSFTAITSARRKSAAEIESGWIALAGVAMLSFFGAVALAAARERRLSAEMNKQRRIG